MIRPEAQIQLLTNEVRLKIRLVQGATATIWTANDCSVPAAGIAVARSGEYRFGRAELAGNASGLFCVLSSDGLVRVSAPIVFASAAN